MNEDERKAGVLEILAILYKIDLSHQEAEVIWRFVEKSVQRPWLRKEISKEESLKQFPENSL